MRAELVLVLALTTPIVILGVASHRTFGVAPTIALFAWIFAFVALLRGSRTRRAASTEAGRVR